jgi:hypothetical protein
MVTKEPRSRFWVVSTHILTTGFAMPAVGALIGFGIIDSTGLTGIAAFLLLLGLQAVGYIGGGYYSLSYIKKVALIEDPTACVKPSIITFVVLAGLGFVVNLGSLVPYVLLSGVDASAPIFAISCLVVLYLVVSLAFAKITQQGFAAMEGKAPDA